MQLPLLRIMFFLVWSVDVFTQRNDHKIRTNVISRSYVHNLNYKELSKSTRRWHRAYRRVINSMDSSEEHSTGVSAKNALNTLINKKNSTSCLMKRNTMDKAKRIRFKYANSLNGTETALVNSPGHKMEKLNPEMPAAMETLGDACNSSKPPLVSKRGAHKMNHRDKRGTIDDQKKAVKRGRRKLRKNSHHSLQLETLVENTRTMWEPMPRPLALNQSLDFSLEMTRSYELFTLPDEYQRETTPQTPDTREKTHEDKNPFYPLRSASYRAYAILCVSIVIFTLGLLGNISIMCIVCHNYYMRSISNSLLANLAIWDFLIIIFCLPLVIFHELTKNWLLGEFSCRIIPYIEVASLGVTTFTLCALCIDRFRAATNVQMYYEMIENCASTTAKLAVIWVGALLLALPELLIRQLVTEEEGSPGVRPCERCIVRISSELPDTVYVLGLTYEGARLWWYFGCYFCLPTLFTIGSSLATARKIRQAERACVRGNKKQIRLESQMNCTVVALAILYGLCVVPENIFNIVSAYMAAGVPRRSMDLLHLISQLLLFSKSAVTPVLLLCLCRPFGRAVLDCCCCCGAARSSAGASDDNDHECTTELELSPFSTIRREMSAYTAVGTHC